MRKVLALLAVIAIAVPAWSQTRELGRILVSELSIREGKISFRVDSNGCTDAGSFKVDVAKEEGASPRVPHHRLTIRRVRVDECKALLWDGVLIEMDLEKDLGLAGAYTLSVENPILPKYRRTE
jgi:hypothetical protein